MNYIDTDIKAQEMCKVAMIDICDYYKAVYDKALANGTIIDYRMHLKTFESGYALYADTDISYANYNKNSVRKVLKNNLIIKVIPEPIFGEFYRIDKCAKVDIYIAVGTLTNSISVRVEKFNEVTAKLIIKSINNLTKHE